MAQEGIFIGTAAGGARQCINLKRANRHGLIAGATGTGKTVTLQGIVEGFSANGVPCFVADVKGDLSGMAMAGSPQGKIHEIFAARAAEIGQQGWVYKDNPAQFWDLFGEQGHPIRTTVSEMGPLMLSRLMDLNEVQEGVLAIAFHVADKDGLPLIGEVPGYPRIHAAYGYGGNGITFSFLASRLIGAMIAGRREPWHDDLAIDRPRPAI